MDKVSKLLVDPNEVSLSSPARRNRPSENESNRIAQLYQDGLSMAQVGDMIGRSPSSVEKSLVRKGIKRRPIRRYALNESFFDSIDSHEKAQILGLIAADGCVYEGGKNLTKKILAIVLHEQDVDYLKEIKDRIGYSGPLGRIAYKKQLRLAVTSNPLFQGLARSGIWPRKSLTLLFPSKEVLPEEFLSSYILGYFEGDGSIGYYCPKLYPRPQYQISFALTKEFGEALKDIFSKWGIGSCLGKYKYEGNENKNVYRLVVSGNLNSKKLMTILYKNAAFKMKRKHDRFLSLLSMYDASKATP